MSSPTTVFKYKCLQCHLHFALYTETENKWRERTPYCPECKNNTENQFAVYSEKIDSPIFSLIPGESKALALNHSDKSPKGHLRIRLKGLFSSGIVASLIITAIIALIAVATGNFWFWAIAGAFLSLTAWIYERKNMNESAKFFIVALIFMLAYGLYLSSRPSGGSSYLQEACPNCDQF